MNKNNNNLDFVHGVFASWCYLFDVQYIQIERNGNGVLFKIGDKNELHIISPLINIELDKDKLVQVVTQCLRNLEMSYRCEQDKVSLQKMMNKD